MNLDEMKNQLIEWVHDLGYRGASYKEKFCMHVTNDRILLNLYTSEHRYCITAHPGTKTYLGCILDVRKARPGELHTRGADLPDGPFNEKTWLAIVKRIVGMELVPLDKPISGMYEPQRGDDIEAMETES